MVTLPDISALRLLQRVLQDGSISAAARGLGISQQAASTRIRAMERSLGLELLVRTPAGVRATADGEVFAAWMQDLLHSADTLADAVDGLRGTQMREVTIAASQTVAAHLLPTWLLRVRQTQLAAGREPTTIRIRATNSQDVARLVREGQASVGLIETPDLPRDLSHAVLVEDELVVAVGTSDPAAQNTQIRVSDLASVPLITREPGSGTRLAWEHAAHDAGYTPAPPAIVMDNSSAIRSAVQAGIAPTVTSAHVIADDVRLGRILQIPLDPPVRRPITAIWRGSERDLGEYARELIRAARL
ncbi:LysR family transcriptional regulator [Microbacterium sp. SY138]|uniref:LysR family transcriptional regulator n=1 Tax=unclassified Microbacterium TaxID=2609290 RepID=UPI00321978BE